MLEYLTVRDNILLPYRISAELELTPEVIKRVEELVTETGIGEHIDSHPQQLSQGERQRAAICRALITVPELILADEPTGNLDPDNKHKVLDILLEQVERNNATLVMVTHDHDLLGSIRPGSRHAGVARAERGVKSLLYMAWRYLAFNRIKTVTLVAVITVIIFLPMALQLVLDRSSARLTARASQRRCWQVHPEAPWNSYSIRFISMAIHPNR